MHQTIIVIHAGPHFSLMLSPVHIAIYHKIHTARLIHADNLNIMLIPYLTGISALGAAKAEHLNDSFIQSVEAPQFPFLHKRNDISGLICCVLNITITDSQHNCIPIHKERVLSMKNLIHAPLEVQHIHTGTGKAQSIIFFYIVIFRLATVTLCRHHILQSDHGIGIIDFLERRHRFRKLLPIKIRPCDLL